MLLPASVYNWHPEMQLNVPPHNSARSGRAIAVLPALASIAIFATGCGGSSTSSASGGQSPKPTGTSALFQFSSCMRNHGVTNFPDPRVTVASANSREAVLAIPRSAASSPQFKAAQKACHGILPAPQNASPVQVAQQQHAREQDLLAFASCVRTHGVSDFPDPTSQGQLTIEMITAAGVDLHAPVVLSAAEACIGVSHGVITPDEVKQAVSGQL